MEDANLNFEPQMVGTVSPVQSFKIWNVGSATGTLDTVKANGVTGIQVTHNCGALAPGSYCTVQVQAAPNASVPGGGGILIQSSSGQVSDDNPFADAITSQDPIYLSLSSISFGTVLVGQTSLPHIFTVANATNSPLTVPTPIVKGSTFSITGTNCAAPLQPQKTCSPTAPAPNSFTSDTGTISFTGSSYPITLGGQGATPAQVTVNPVSLNFGTVTGAGSATLSVTLTNAGSATVVINGLAVTTKYFSIGGTCGTALASLQSCNVTVTVDTSEYVGTLSDALNIALDNGLTSLSVPLSAVAPPLLSASPASLDFGASTIATTTSAAQTVTINNISGAAPGVSPTFTGSFQASSNNCPAPIPAGQSCSISVVFVPMQTGTQTGSMTLVSSTGASLLVVPFTGTAVPVPPIVAFAPQSGGSTSVTVTAGKTATYHLVATASALFSGGIALSCSGAPTYSTCTVSPTSPILAAGSQTSIAVTVTTELTLSSSAGPVHQPFSLAGAGVSSVLAAFFIFFRRRKLSATLFPAIAILMTGLLLPGLLACSGGASSGSTGPTVSTTPPGTYTLQLSAVSGGSVTVNQPLTLIVQ